jgi:fructosamine-3-kinase
MVGSFPAEIGREIELHTNSTIRGFTLAGGGCINNGGRVDTTDGVFFLKWNNRKRYPGMFAAEAKGLSLLRAAKSLKIPDVIFVSEAGENQFLVLEYIEHRDKRKSYWRDFGYGLAQIHRQTRDKFGLDHDNYIGSLVQENSATRSWVDFFIQQRLTVQLRLAVDSGKLGAETLRLFERLFVKLPGLLPQEPPSLLHGDLWAGNIMATAQGDPCLIDPAVYFGNREVDLAMTALFGGFDPLYHESYNEAYPLQPGWEERVDVYNLYPLLVHVNLFGGSYIAQTLTVVKRFV